MKDRSSLTVKVGRIIQKYYSLFGFLDKVFTKNKTDSVPVICILAAPRSGSTLTYQVLTEAFENNHLTNLTNLLYSTPTLSFKLQRFFCKNHASTFKSIHGFVSGVCGEAEGLKFWEYWTSQSLKESTNLSKKNLKILHDRLKKVDNKPFITGYLGHPFSIKLLREEFENILFIHLERDMLSHSYSLYKFYGKNEQLCSTSPLKCMQRKYNDTFELVVDQIIEIQNSINEHSSNDFIKINYEDLCNNPNNIVEIIQKKAKTLGIDIIIKNRIKPFSVSQVESNKNDNTKMLNDLILKKTNE